MSNQFLQYIPYIREAVLFAAMIWQRKAISAFLYALLGDSAKPPGNISSRRFIAVASTLMFLYLCYFSVTNSKDIEPVCAWSLFLLISLSMGYTTFTQANSIITNLRGMIPGAGVREPEPEKKQPVTEITVNNNQS